MTLDQLVEGLREAWGGNLAAIVLYGSAAGTDYHGPASDQNVLVLVHEANVGAFQLISRVVRRWVGVGNPPPLVLTSDEWRRSADVFAIEYADLLERHRVLFGRLPTEGIRVRRRDIRQQLETEAMGKLLRLRRGLMSAGDDARRLRGLLDDVLSSALALFRATLRLHGEAIPASSDAVCDRAASLAGFGAAEFRTALAHRRGSARLGPGDAQSILHAIHEALESLVAHIDRVAVDD